jgi:hypothetical protein
MPWFQAFAFHKCNLYRCIEVMDVCKGVKPSLRVLRARFSVGGAAQLLHPELDPQRLKGTLQTFNLKCDFLVSNVCFRIQYMYCAATSRRCRTTT